MISIVGFLFVGLTCTFGSPLRELDEPVSLRQNMTETPCQVLVKELEVLNENRWNPIHYIPIFGQTAGIHESFEFIRVALDAIKTCIKAATTCSPEFTNAEVPDADPAKEDEFTNASCCVKDFEDVCTMKTKLANDDAPDYTQETLEYIPLIGPIYGYIERQSYMNLLLSAVLACENNCQN